MPRFFRAPPRIPTRADIDAVLRVTDSDERARDHLLVAVAAGTGLRVHELVALDWGQLVTEAGAVRHRVHLRAEDTKGGVGGDVVLNEALRWKVARDRTWCARRATPPRGTRPCSCPARSTTAASPSVWRKRRGARCKGSRASSAPTPSTPCATTSARASTRPRRTYG